MNREVQELQKLQILKNIPQEIHKLDKEFNNFQECVNKQIDSLQIQLVELKSYVEKFTPAFDNLMLQNQNKQKSDIQKDEFLNYLIENQILTKIVKEELEKQKANQLLFKEQPLFTSEFKQNQVNQQQNSTNFKNNNSQDVQQLTDNLKLLSQDFENFKNKKNTEVENRLKQFESSIVEKINQIQNHTQQQFANELNQKLSNIQTQIDQCQNQLNDMKGSISRDLEKINQIEQQQFGYRDQTGQTNIQDLKNYFNEELNKLQQLYKDINAKLHLNDNNLNVITEQIREIQDQKKINFNQQIQQIDSGKQMITQQVPATTIQKPVQESSQFKYQNKNLFLQNQNYYTQLNQEQPKNIQFQQISHNQSNQQIQEQFGQSFKLQNNQNQTYTLQKQSKFQFNQAHLKNNKIFFQDQIRCKKVQEIINGIYDQSCRKRLVNDYRNFTREIEDFPNMCKYYGIKNIQEKVKLKEFCDSFRQVRGDGNCFYTAFGYQLLIILIGEYDNNEFENWINNLNGAFKCQLQVEENLYNQDEFHNLIYNEFIFRLYWFRQIDNKIERIQVFNKHFEAYEQSNNDQSIDGCLYGLTIIFLRNLANYVLINSSQTSLVFDSQNLLIWEKECNSNEIIISQLSNYLKIFVRLIFFHNSNFQIMEYNPQSNYKILLLIQPGHYNIGILSNQQQQKQL